MEKTCTKCGKRGDEYAFAKFKHRDGRIGRRNVCLECRAAHQTENYEHYKKYRKEYNKRTKTKRQKAAKARRMEVKQIVDDIKEKTPCADCGNHFPAVCMDFDHVGQKNRSVANMVSGAYKIDLILEEIKICEVVCACCHRIRTRDKKKNLAPPKKKVDS